MKKHMVSATLEDYLETILTLDREKGAARVRDIAENLSVHKSTVSAMLKSLGEKGLISHAPYQVAQLTAEGRRIAEQVASDHSAIKTFLQDVLLLGDATAAENACRMEHVLDRRVVRRLTQFARFAQAGQSGDWLQHFSDFLAEESGQP